MLLSPFTGSRPPNLSLFVTRRCLAAHPAELWRGAFINSSPFLPMFAVGDDPSFPGLLRWLLCTFAGLPIDLRNSSFINSSPFWPMFCSPSGRLVERHLRQFKPPICLWFKSFSGSSCSASMFSAGDLAEHDGPQQEGIHANSAGERRRTQANAHRKWQGQTKDQRNC